MRILVGGGVGMSRGVGYHVTYTPDACDVTCPYPVHKQTPVKILPSRNFVWAGNKICGSVRLI